MRFHVIGIPHTATNKSYCGCAFTQKVLNMCKMLVKSRHEVYHYGNYGSEVDSSHVNILKQDQVLKPEDALKYAELFKYGELFNSQVIEEINKRKQKHDFLLCAWPGHASIANALNDMIVIESGIGYPSGHFAQFKVFESYAILHAYYGLKAVEKADSFEWYSRVIPNYFDENDFIFSTDKEDYLLFLGMRHGGYGKGYNIAVDVAKDAGVELIIAGPDAPKYTHRHVKYVGLLDVKQRAKYLSKARALIAPSLFLEPFCGAQAEAFLSGTPVISSDWGAFVEYNKHNVTGFRCHTHSEFVKAVNEVRNIDPYSCRAQGMNFSLERVRHLYDEYFSQVLSCFISKGWYA